MRRIEGMFFDGGMRCHRYIFDMERDSNNTYRCVGTLHQPPSSKERVVDHDYDGMTAEDIRRKCGIEIKEL